MTLTPRCIKCGYVLLGLPAGNCPECGYFFDPDVSGTFTTLPLFVRWKYWLPGFLLATVGGIFVYATLVMFVGWGWAATIAAPFCMGAVIGYGCRTSSFMLILMSLTAIFSVVTALFTMNIVGIFCGIVVAAVALTPILVGTLAGVLLRLFLKVTEFEQRGYLPLLILTVLPATVGLVERVFDSPRAIESVVTSMDIPAPVGRAWNALMFYEDVPRPRPWLLRIGLPTPLHTMGGIERVGDVRFCIYSKGRLAKQVSRRVPERELAFNVVVQDRVENHSIRLTGGSFAFRAIEPNSTHVELTTSYQPKLGPRFIWRPAERLAVHALHRYVLEGMSEQAARP